MPGRLDDIRIAVGRDPGLRAAISDARIEKGLNAADRLNTTLLKAINLSGVNDDHRLTAGDMAKISRTVFNSPALWQDFILAHGNDAGRTTGFHWVQNDGGTLQFQGRAFIDTVADAIYHFGFQVKNGRYFNEDGNDNETLVDVAGWLNFFLNGENIVYGSDKADGLYVGDYSNYFAAARNETFLAGGGNDSIGGNVGSDKIFGGRGADQAGGEEGKDKLFGGAGNDSLYGGDGNDTISGGADGDVMGGADGGDVMYGGANADTAYGNIGNDRMYGGAGFDRLDGNESADRVYGGSGNDTLGGNDGDDRLYGGSGRDSLSGGSGNDYYDGGAGADEIFLWGEADNVRDVVAFGRGDSGETDQSMDTVYGFASGTDKIDLRAFGNMAFTRNDFLGRGRDSCYFDGDFLRFDVNGDGRQDMIVAFENVASLSKDDFIF